MEYDYREAMKLSNQLCFPIYAAARGIVNLYTPYLKPLGITYTQYLVFLVLWEEGSATVGGLCEKLMLDNGTITPLLKKMQAAGYVEKRRSDRDDRVVVVSLTDAGRDLQERAKEIPRQMASCVDLPLEKARELYALLYELLEKSKNE